MKKLICSAVIASMFIMSAVPVFAYDLPENTIAVSGRGIVSVEPDTAQISLAVVTSNSDAAKAQEENNRIYNNVCESLKAAGIKEDDIKSTWYYVYTERDYENNNEVTGYRVENSANYLMSCAKKGYEKEWTEANEKAELLKEHIKSLGYE